MRWWSPRWPVEPMYIPGRLRTASRPSRTVMSWAAYEPFFLAPFFSGCFAKSFLPPRKAPTPEPLSAGSGRYIRPLWILAGYPPNRTVPEATKCPQIATKCAFSATVRARTRNEPQLRHRSGSEGGLEAGQQVRAEQVQFLRPDPRFAGHGDHAVALRDRRRGRREAGAGDLGPGRLDLGEERCRGDVGEGAVERVCEEARGQASHEGVGLISRGPLPPAFRGAADERRALTGSGRAGLGGCLTG